MMFVYPEKSTLIPTYFGEGFKNLELICKIKYLT